MNPFPNRIEFGWVELNELAHLLAALNRAGVPYRLRRDKIAIEVAIGTGY